MRQGTLINHKRTNFFHTVLLFAGMVILLATLGQVLGGVKGLLWAIESATYLGVSMISMFSNSSGAL